MSARGEGTTAKIADGALVVSIVDSAGAKIWRADMRRLSSAVFELQEAAGKTALFLKSPEGTEDIFAFSSRPAAIAALDAVTQALFTGAGAEAAAPPPAPHKKTGFFRKALKAVFYGFLALVALFFLLLFLTARPVTESGRSGGTSGKPIPAEQLFGQ